MLFTFSVGKIMSDPSANGNNLSLHGGSGSGSVPGSMSNASNFELDSASEWSDTSSLDGSMSGATTPILHRNFPTPSAPLDYSAGLSNNPVVGLVAPTASREQMTRLVERLQQENRVLKMEVETQKMRIKSLQEENKGLRQQSVMIVSGRSIDWLIDWIVFQKTLPIGFARLLD